jgi:group I intron endonuclease
MRAVDLFALRGTPGVYKIEHRASGRVYVGSSKDMWTRRRHHWAQLARGKHCNPVLQAAWMKYGRDAFSFEVLEITSADKASILDAEQRWLDGYSLVTELYNILPFAHSALGVKRRAETRARMSAAMQGRKLTAETIAKRTASRDYRQTPETIAKRAAAMRGRPVSVETRAKIAAALRGQPFTPQRCANIAAGMRRAAT